MVQIVEQTKEEKIAMYMKLNKKVLAEMVYNCNIVIDSIQPTVTKEHVYRVMKRGNIERI